MNIILLEYRKGWNRNREEKREGVKIWWNEKIWKTKTDKCPYIIYLQIKYMVGNQNYIVTNYNNKISRCMGELGKKFVITWLHTEDLLTAELVKSPVHVGYQNSRITADCLCSHFRAILQFQWRAIWMASN